PRRWRTRSADSRVGSRRRVARAAVVREAAARPLPRTVTNQSRSFGVSRPRRGPSHRMTTNQQSIQWRTGARALRVALPVVALLAGRVTFAGADSAAAGKSEPAGSAKSKQTTAPAPAARPDADPTSAKRAGLASVLRLAPEQ